LLASDHACQQGQNGQKGKGRTGPSVSPPASTLAPWATASASRVVATASAAGVISGPMMVSGSLGDLVGVHVDAGHRMAEVGEAGPGDEADIAGADHCDVQGKP
jgi:hypothetical protein